MLYARVLRKFFESIAIRKGFKEKSDTENQYIEPIQRTNTENRFREPIQRINTENQYIESMQRINT